MHQQRVEYDGVAGVHGEVHHVLLEALLRHVLDTEVRLVHQPVRGVVVLLQGQDVCPWEGKQSAHLSVDGLQGGPGAHDPVDRAEGEVPQVLVRWVAG